MSSPRFPYTLAGGESCCLHLSQSKPKVQVLFDFERNTRRRLVSTKFHKINCSGGGGKNKRNCYCACRTGRIRQAAI